MRLKEHIDKVSWSVADKFLFVIYGIVTIVQFNAMKPEEMGLFALLITIFNWIFIISDSFALQNLIQFGQRKHDRGFINFVVSSFHITITLGASLLMLLFGNPLSVFFNEPRLIEVFEFLIILTFFNIPRTYAIKIFYRDTNMRRLFFTNAMYFGVMTFATLSVVFYKRFLTFNELVYIYLIGTLISSLVALFYIKNELTFRLKGQTRLKEIINFSVPYTLTSAIHLAPRQLDVYLIQYFFQTKIVGIYFLAKNLFRAFEEIVNAANGLIYPAAVRQIAKNDFNSLFDMATKALSYILFFNMFTIILLNLGLTDLFIKWFLPEKYYLAIPFFNLLSFVAIGLPFTILGSVLIAFNQPTKTMKIMSISLVFWLLSFIVVGIINRPLLIPVPHIIYFFILSLLLFLETNKHINISFKDILRFIPDVFNIVINLLKTRK